MYKKHFRTVLTPFNQQITIKIEINRIISFSQMSKIGFLCIKGPNSFVSFFSDLFQSFIAL